MSKLEKVSLRPYDPFAPAQGLQVYQPDPRAKVSTGIDDTVTDLLSSENGGDIQLPDKDGKLQTVHIKGLSES